MFEKLTEIGEAFKSFGKKDDEVEIDERSSIEKLDDFNIEKDIISATQSKESKDIESIDDTSTTESVKDILIKDEKEKLEKKEDSLDTKLRNIEKVIETFSGAPEMGDIPKQDTGSASDNINVKPLDMANVQAKEVINEYLKPSVNADRVGLLYENLRKLNLI
tara:strand:+ start:433 stop:921 length:489 start_codon:yes stop_codon:yes gene_type:complete